MWAAAIVSFHASSSTARKAGAGSSGSSPTSKQAPEEPGHRFVVTNLSKRNARGLYEDVYCRRGQAENHIKSWKTHLAADRTSCSELTANQFRLFRPACGRVLADVGPTRVDARKRSIVARRPVRYVAPPPDQDRRPHRRDEDHDPGALADLMPRSGYPALRSGTHTAPPSPHDRRGMRPQTFTDVPSTRKPSSPRPRLQAGADEPRPNIGGLQQNHPNPSKPCAISSKRCIQRATYPSSNSTNI